MGILKALSVAIGLTSPMSDTQITAAMDPWTLACAVGAENGSIGTAMGFDTWLRISRANWMPRLRTTIDASENEIESALRNFVAVNRNKKYQDVLREEEAKRGLGHTPILGPGESMTVTIPLSR